MKFQIFPLLRPKAAGSFPFQNLMTVAPVGRPREAWVQDLGLLLSAPLSPLTVKEFDTRSLTTGSTRWVVESHCHIVLINPVHPTEGHPSQAIRTDSWDRAGDYKPAPVHTPTTSDSLPFSFLKCKAGAQLWIWETGQCPVQRETATGTEKTLWCLPSGACGNQGQWIHWAINNFISKANICVCSGSLCSLRMNCSAIGHRRKECDAWGARTMEEFITEQVESFSGALLRADDSLF